MGLQRQTDDGDLQLSAFTIVYTGEAGRELHSAHSSQPHAICNSLSRPADQKRDVYLSVLGCFSQAGTNRLPELCLMVKFSWRHPEAAEAGSEAASSQNPNFRVNRSRDAPSLILPTSPSTAFTLPSIRARVTQGLISLGYLVPLDTSPNKIVIANINYGKYQDDTLVIFRFCFEIRSFVGDMTF